MCGTGIIEVNESEETRNAWGDGGGLEVLVPWDRSSRWNEHSSRNAALEP
jgi:hypothetical protein